MYQQAAEFIASKLHSKPQIGLVLGTGLNSLADAIEDAVVIPFSEIPHFPVSTVHQGTLVAGRLNGKAVLCMQGRVHFYEGYSMQQLGLPIQVMRVLGVKTVILTNASGGICESYFPGEIVMLSDHIKLAPESPLCGKNPEGLGERFFDMTTAYDQELRNLAKEAAEELGLPLPEGVYAYMGGPQFETPAEIRALRVLGADLVGMSTVPEVIAARHCNVKVLAFSCVTNMAAGMKQGGLDKAVIQDAERRGQNDMLKLLTKVVEKL